MKKYLITLFLVVSILFLASCGYSDEEIAEKEKWEEMAAVKATEYILEKYNEDLKITSATAEKENDAFSPSYLPLVMVEGTINNKNVLVFVDIEGESNCSDNYQREEIFSDIEKYIKETYSEKLMKMDFYFYDNYSYPSECLINTYYDGNLEELLKNIISSKIFLYYKGVDNIENILEIYPLLKNMHCNIVNFKNDIQNDILDFAIADNFELNIPEMLPYINDFYITNVEYGLNTYFKNDIKNFNNEFLYSGNSFVTQTLDFTINEEQNIDIKNWNDNDVSYKKVSAAYKSIEDTFIYFPKNNIDNYSLNKDYVVCEYYDNENGKGIYNTFELADINEYLFYENDWRNGYWFIAEQKVK